MVAIAATSPSTLIGSPYLTAEVTCIIHDGKCEKRGKVRKRRGASTWQTHWPRQQLQK
jgi:hypothetical protein